MDFQLHRAHGLRRVDSPGAFLEDPIGSSIAGRTFVLWAQTPHRIGAFHNGSGHPRDAEMIAALFPIFAHPKLAARYDILHDLADVGAIDGELFDFFERFLRAWIDVLALRVRRVAVVRPSGLVGAAFTGLFHQWVAPRLDARLCEDRRQAYAWLSLTADEAVELDAQRAALSGPAMLRRVRDAIQRRLADASLACVAVQLGLGARTLQRQLAGLGTSFRDEVIRVRIALAKTHLMEGTDKVESIARRVGFASCSSFSASFHKIVGVAPTEFRAHKG